MIDWPAGIERTPPNERRRNNSFEVSLATAGSDLETQMDRLDPDEWRAETGSGGSHTFSNGLPKASANPDDPGVVVRWTDDGHWRTTGTESVSEVRVAVGDETLDEPELPDRQIQCIHNWARVDQDGVYSRWECRDCGLRTETPGGEEP